MRIISIHSLLAEGDLAGFLRSLPVIISIHSLLAEGDLNAGMRIRTFRISIHSLLAEGDVDTRLNDLRDCDFNPLPPRGGRLEGTGKTPFPMNISIHSLLAEGDPAPCTSYST